MSINCRVIAKGASGGHGRLSRKSSHGAIIKAIIKLKRGFEILSGEFS